MYATNAIFNVNLGYTSVSGALNVGTPLLGATWCGGATLGAALNVNSLVSTGSVTFATAGYQLTASTITNSGTIQASNSTVIVSGSLINTGSGFANLSNATVIAAGTGTVTANPLTYSNLLANAAWSGVSNQTAVTVLLTNAATRILGNLQLVGTPSQPVTLGTIGNNQGTLTLNQPGYGLSIKAANFQHLGSPMTYDLQQPSSNLTGAVNLLPIGELQ